LRLLPDTLLRVWFATAQSRLPDDVRKMFADPEADLVWSVVPLSEVAIKAALGR